MSGFTPQNADHQYQSQAIGKTLTTNRLVCKELYVNKVNASDALTGGSAGQIWTSSGNNQPARWEAATGNSPYALVANYDTWTTNGSSADITFDPASADDYFASANVLINGLDWKISSEGAGTYLFTASTFIKYFNPPFPFSGSTSRVLNITVNGAQQTNMGQLTFLGTGVPMQSITSGTLSGSFVTYLNAGDLIRFQIRNITSGPVEITQGENAVFTMTKIA